MTRKHHVILGAGISGLALAWYLKQRFGDEISLTILEKATRAGGWIKTSRCDGFLFEEGPRSCRTNGTGVATLQLIEQLGLADEVITASPAARRRFLYVDGRLQSLPTGPLSFLCSSLMRGVFPALWKEWSVPPSKLADETVYDFVSRRFSPELAERFADPLVSGIFAGDIRKLSMRSCFPSMYCLEQEHGSILKGMLARTSLKQREEVSPFVQSMLRHPIFSFKNGMETLVERLGIRLKDELRLGCAANRLEFSEDRIRVHLDNGDKVLADRLFLTIPSSEIFSLLRPHGIHGQEVPTVSVGVVNIGWKSEQLKHQGFGHLIPRKEKKDILGVVWDSAVFPQQGRFQNETRLTVMMGGAHLPEIETLSEKDLTQRALKAVKDQLGIVTSPDAIQVKSAMRAIPQYMVGHADRTEQLEGQLARLSPHVFLLGSSWHGVSVNDCIAKGYAAAQRL